MAFKVKLKVLVKVCMHSMKLKCHLRCNESVKMSSVKAQAMKGVEISAYISAGQCQLK